MNAKYKNDTQNDTIGQIYDATPPNSDIDSDRNCSVCTELSDEEGFLSEESDLEGQFGVIREDSSNETTSFREIKVRIHCGDVMYPLHKGALISSHNCNTQEVILHGDFGGKYFKDYEFYNKHRGVNLSAVVQNDGEVNNEEIDLVEHDGVNISEVVDNDDEVNNEEINLIEHDVEVNNEEMDVGTMIDSSSL